MGRGLVQCISTPISMEGLENHRELGQNNWFPDQDSNQLPPEYK